MSINVKKLTVVSFDLDTDCDIEQITQHILDQPDVTKIRRIDLRAGKYQFLVELNLNKDAGFTEAVDEVVPQVWAILNSNSLLREVWVDDCALTAPKPENAVDFTTS